MIKKEFLNLNESLSCDKNGYQGIWKFWVNGKGGPKVWNQALWSPLWYRFFLTNHFHVIKTAIKAFENFGSRVRGGPMDLKSGPVVPPLVSIFLKDVVTIPGRFQMIKKEFLNLNQSLSSDKNGYQGIWKFWVNGKGGPKVWNQALWCPLWYRFFSKLL